MKYLILLLLILISGCFFGRIDIEDDRTSVTVWTIGKDVTFDPNHWQSESNKVRALTPAGTIRTE